MATSSPLPIVDGVAPSYLWLPVGEWPNLLSFLEQRFPTIDRLTWMARMMRGEVVDGDGLQLAPDSPYRSGSCIFYYREPPAETPIPFAETILYQDERILVADKPHFLPVIPTGRFLHETLLVRLKKKTGLSNLTPIHRIDRETAGVIVFSYDIASRGAYQSLFQQRLVNKTYEALAPTAPQLMLPLIYRSRMVDGTPFFRMQEVDGESNSETRIELIEQRVTCSLYRLRPLTGKKHQLRVHLAALGIPIVNDTFYPDVYPCKGDDFSAPLKLLAREIAFIDPLDQCERRFTSLRVL